jgi:hypothetical protein
MSCVSLHVIPTLGVPYHGRLLAVVTVVPSPLGVASVAAVGQQQAGAPNDSRENAQQWTVRSTPVEVGADAGASEATPATNGSGPGFALLVSMGVLLRVPLLVRRR